MPHGFDKSASVVAGSLDDLVKIMRKSNVKDPIKATEHFMGKDSGSIILDGVGAILNKVPGGKNVTTGYKHMQRKMVDMDIKAGKKIHDSLDKTKFGQKINKAFVHNHAVPVSSAKGKPDKLIQVGVPMATAPIEKAKKVALPFVGSMVVADKLMGIGDNKKEGGDTVKAANYREELMNKIASHVSGAQTVNHPVETGNDKVASTLLLKASQMLKFAAEERKQMLSDMEKLALENRQLHNELVVKDKQEAAIKLAEEMNEKGMIKKADIQKKANEIMVLDNDAFTLLKQATDNVSRKVEKDGLDNLTFLTEDYNIKSSKKTLADAIEEI